MTNLKANYIGSQKIETSKAGENILELLEWDKEKYEPLRFKRFAFMSLDDCTIQVNDGTDIFLRANQGFFHEDQKEYLESVVIKEDGIEFQMIGAY